MPKKSKKKGNKSETKDSISTVNFSSADLMQKAEELIDQFEFEAAQKFLQRALEMDPNNTKIMDFYAVFLLDLDDFEGAKNLLEKSIQLEPTSNPEKYMNYGQILEGKQAIQTFNKGIQLMIQEKERIDKGAEGDSQLLCKQISTGLCSIAEIYLTDSCFEEIAESECCRLMDEALKYDQTNPEIYQTLANIRISQQKNDEALQLLHKNYSLWKDTEEKPSYEFRHNTAKLFLELEQAEVAADIWDSLLDEDDNIAEVHYFYGLALSTLDSEASLQALSKASELLKQAPDVGLLKDINSLITHVQNNPVLKVTEGQDQKEEEENEEEQEEEEEEEGEEEMDLEK